MKSRVRLAALTALLAAISACAAEPTLPARAGIAETMPRPRPMMGAMPMSGPIMTPWEEGDWPISRLCLFEGLAYSEGALLPVPAAKAVLECAYGPSAGDQRERGPEAADTDLRWRIYRSSPR